MKEKQYVLRVHDMIAAGIYLSTLHDGKLSVLESLQEFFAAMDPDSNGFIQLGNYFFDEEIIEALNKDCNDVLNSHFKRVEKDTGE